MKNFGTARLDCFKRESFSQRLVTAYRTALFLQPWRWKRSHSAYEKKSTNSFSSWLTFYATNCNKHKCKRDCVIRRSIKWTYELHDNTAASTNFTSEKKHNKLRVLNSVSHCSQAVKRWGWKPRTLFREFEVHRKDCCKRVRRKKNAIMHSTFVQAICFFTLTIVEVAKYYLLCYMSQLRS